MSDAELKELIMKSQENSRISCKAAFDIADQTGTSRRKIGELLDELGANIVAISVLIELRFLDGRSKLPNHPVHSILEY